MLIITLIHAFILFPAISARPATAVPPTIANGRWTNDTHPASPRRAMFLNASSIIVPQSIQSKSQYPAMITLNQLSEASASKTTRSDTPLFNASFPVCSSALYFCKNTHRIAQQKELKVVTIKYSSATRYLKGTGLSPMPNFTMLSDLLGINDPSTVCT